jgi:hypothetical protein
MDLFALVSRPAGIETLPQAGEELRFAPSSFCTIAFLGSAALAVLACAFL